MVRMLALFTTSNPNKDVSRKWNLINKCVFMQLNQVIGCKKTSNNLKVVHVTHVYNVHETT